MALTTNTKECKPKDMPISKKFITNAKGKWKIIEKAYKEYGPGVINNLLSIGKKYSKDNPPPDEKFTNMIANPYETLCFFENYFDGARNFKEIEKYFEKARKTLETAAKRSRPFKETLDHHGFVYITDDVKKLEYKENPDNDPKTKFPILKDESGKPVPNYAEYCCKVINDSYNSYKKAHDNLKEIKQKIISKLNKNQSETFELLQYASRNAHEAFKNIVLIPEQIDQLYIKANTKVHTFQTKTFKSKELENLMLENKKLKNIIKSIKNNLRRLSSLKYGNIGSRMFNKNNWYTILYDKASQLQSYLISNDVNYDSIQEKLDDLIEETNKRNQENKNLSAPSDDEIKKIKHGDVREHYTKLIEFTTNISNQSLEISDYIEKMDKAIEAFQESYTVKGWAKWIAIKGGITLLTITKTINKLLLDLTKYNDALGFVHDIGKYVISDGHNPMFWEDD